MAPALTQTADPPDLADATRHSPPPKAATSASSPYGHLKENSRIRQVNGDRILDTRQTLIPNGDCTRSGLAPPASGRAEGRPVPNNSPFQSNMEEDPPFPISDMGSDHTNNTGLSFPYISPSVDSSMGLQSCLSNVNLASDPDGKGSEVTTSNPALEETQTMMNQNELLALVGRDFNNVSDIIDTLQRLASNPELLDATARDLEPSSSTQCTAEAVQAPENCATKTLSKLAERQRHLERRKLFLLRRISRITGRGLVMTVSNNLCHLIRHSRSTMEKEQTGVLKVDKVGKNLEVATVNPESMKSMSTSDLISLVRRMEASQNMHKMTASHPNYAKEAISLPSSLCSQIDAVTAEMKAAALSHIHHDSDATESSSGGESCDESEAFHKSNTNYKQIRERAFYRYCRTRGWVASRWMWLQAQIADLDCRISHQEEQYSRIRANKGAVLFSEESSVKKGEKVSIRNPAHLDMQDSALTCIASPSTVRTTINGYHPATKVDDVTSAVHGVNINSAGVHELGSESARTLGVQKVKRRRYVKPHMIVKQSPLRGTLLNMNRCREKNSTALCKCVPPMLCILCAKPRSCSKNVWYGNCSFGSAAFDIQPVAEKLSKLDPAFHPVLSRKPALLQSELYKTTMRSYEWQQKAVLNRILPLSQPVKKDYDLTDMDDDEDMFEPHFKRRRRDMKKNSRSRYSSHSLRKSSRQSVSLLEEDDDEFGRWYSSVGSTHSSPCPSPALSDKAERVGKFDKISSDAKGSEGRVLRRQTTMSAVTTSLSSSSGTSSSSSHRQKQNSTSSSYDINNIVIPYSMAASSRVELLKYKEIPTPKWRIEEIKSMAASLKGKVLLEEDVSDDTVAARHSRSEAMERKKFLHYLQWQVNSTRSSRSRRTDSSGTNTPDHPLSPRTLEQTENSPMGSPPGTPQMGPSEDSNNSSCHASVSASKSQATVLTLSLSSLQTSLLNSSNGISSSTEPLNRLLVNQSSISEEVPQSDVPHVSPTPAATTKVNSISDSTSSNVEGQPALRTRRSLSADGQEQALRSISVSSLLEEQSEKDRVSPFPSRDFPLTENDYQDLVTEDSDDDKASVDDLSKRFVTDNTKVTSSASLTVPVCIADTVASELSGNKKLESGRDSPLSELTESAPEEDGAWEDETSPEWTISAVHDHSGGLVLQVQKN